MYENIILYPTRIYGIIFCFKVKANKLCNCFDVCVENEEKRNERPLPASYRRQMSCCCTVHTLGILFTDCLQSHLPQYELKSWASWKPMRWRWHHLLVMFLWRATWEWWKRKSGLFLLLCWELDMINFSKKLILFFLLYFLFSSHTKRKKCVQETLKYIYVYIFENVLTHPFCRQKSVHLVQVIILFCTCFIVLKE
jgi:hypothetical protein